jgi:hypothetical protein
VIATNTVGSSPPAKVQYDPSIASRKFPKDAPSTVSPT